MAASPVVDGNTPTLRLEQDGSSGFTPQTYDVASNEANFFIRDVTNGSRLFFRSKPGAPEDSIFIDTDGDIGLGTDSPTAHLHVFDNAGSGGEDMLRLQNNGNPAIIMDNTAVSRTWELTAGDNFIIRPDGGANNFIQVDHTTGNVTFHGTLVTGAGGSCSAGSPCDRVFDPTVYKVPSIEEHAAAMWEKKHLPAVGPTREGEPINVPVKLTRMLNELEKAHIYIEQLHKRISSLEESSSVE